MISCRADLFKKLPKPERIEFYVKFFWEADRRRLQFNGIAEVNALPETEEIRDKRKRLYDVMMEELKSVIGFQNEGGVFVRQFGPTREGDASPEDFVRYIRSMINLDGLKKSTGISDVGQVVNVDGKTILFMVVME